MKIRFLLVTKNKLNIMQGVHFGAKVFEESKVVRFRKDRSRRSCLSLKHVEIDGYVGSICI